MKVLPSFNRQAAQEGNYLTSSATSSSRTYGLGHPEQLTTFCFEIFLVYLLGLPLWLFFCSCQISKFKILPNTNILNCYLQIYNSMSMNYRSFPLAHKLLSFFLNLFKFLIVQSQFLVLCSYYIWKLIK